MDTFNEKQSLALINQMIEGAKNNIRKGSGDLIMLNGMAVAIICLLNVGIAYLLIHWNLNANYSFWVWSLMIPVNIIDKFIDHKKQREAMVKTHIDRIIGSVWTAFGITIWLYVGMIFAFAYTLNIHEMFNLITPGILLMCGLALYTTAKSCKFKPFAIGAFVMWIGAIVCITLSLILNNSLVQFIIMALCMILGFVIPGRKLNQSANV